MRIVEDELKFFNFSNGVMSFDEIFENMKNYIKQGPNYRYVLAIGTDAQVKSRDSLFITGIILSRTTGDGIGRGHWGCRRRYLVDRRVTSLREKISTETSLTYELVNIFIEEKLSELLETLIQVNNKYDFTIEVHLDVGRRGKTRELINEMKSYFAGMNVIVKIKPESYAASWYANRYTK